MNKPVAKATPTPTSGATPPSKFKLIFIGIVVALVLGAALYGFGFFRGNAQLAAQKADSESRIQLLQNQLGEKQGELSVVQNRVHLMQARAELYRTALDLERRNFGIANTHLKDSAALLSHLESTPGIDVEKLSALRDAVAKTDINVAVDLEAQRNTVLDFAAQLEALVPQDAVPASDVE